MKSDDYPLDEMRRQHLSSDKVRKVPRVGVGTALKM
jgi:hypothetical protein